MNASAIDECHLIFFAGETAIKYLGFVVKQLLTDNAPFLTEHYMDLPLGGVDDMSIWTARMWNRFASWVEVSPPCNCCELSLPIWLYDLLC